MRYLPVLDELLSSDTIIVLLIGLVFSLVVGLVFFKQAKSVKMSLVVSLMLYALCEIMSNIRFSMSYMVDFVALFVGTICIGAFLGNILCLIVRMIKKG